MKRFFYFFLIFLFIIPSTFSSDSIGINGPRGVEIKYQTGLIKNYSYTIHYNKPIELRVQGDLAEYVKLSKYNLTLNENKKYETINFIINLPIDPDKKGIKAGKHDLYLLAEGSIPEGVTSARPALRSKISIIRPLPDYYIESEFRNEIKLKTKNIPIYVSVINLGLDLDDVYSQIEIFNKNKLIKTLKTNSLNLKSAERKTLTANWTNSEPPIAGIYSLKGKVYFKNKYVPIEDTLKIGDLEIRIDNFTTALIENKINPIKINAFNLWNEPIKQVYFDYILKNSTGDIIASTQGAPKTAYRFSKVEFENFINVKNIKPGNYFATVKLNYQGKQSNKTLPVKIIKEKFLINLSTPGLLAIIIISLIILNILILLIFMRKKKK